MDPKMNQEVTVRMPSGKLTDQFVKKLRGQGRRLEYWDQVQRGLGLRVSSDGTKTWDLRYRVGGRRRRATLGRYPEVRLGKARELALAELGKVAEGQDPQAKRKATKLGQISARNGTFRRLAEDYLQYARENRKTSVAEDERQLRKDVLPKWSTRPVSEITRQDVGRVLDRIKNRGALVQANRTRTLLGTIFNYALSDEKWEGLITANPALQVKKPLRRETPRERVLSEKEIMRFWAVLEAFDPVIAATFKLQLVTAQRGIEVRTMRWSDVDSDWWTIPAERTKNGRQHRVFLSPQAQGAIDELRLLTGDSRWVLASSRRADQPVGKLNKAKERLTELAQLEDFRPHDLRRTAATFMGKLAVKPDVIGRVLNHTDHGVTARVYNRYNYDAEIRDALALWGERLGAIISGNDVAEVVSIA